MSGLAAAREALQAGRLMEAVDAARDILEVAPRETEALYLKALALSRLGASALAGAALSDLLSRPDTPPTVRADALALQGRLLKDRAARAVPARLSELALLASAPYEEALELQPGAFFAVNAATLHRLAGDSTRSEALAREALRLAERPDEARDHWGAATLGECHLLLGSVAEATRHYREAGALAGRRYGDIASMRRQLRLMARVIPEAANVLEDIPAPTVVAFSGHMIDAAGRPEPRFPASLEPAVAAALEKWLDAVGSVIGYSQAACGSDILFLEALQRRGCETHVTLPCAIRDYVRGSVSFAGGDWEYRFERALANATTVDHSTAEAYLGDDVLFEHASRYIDGLVVLRAKQLEGHAMMLAVLDEGASAAIGGTRETLDEWRRAGGRSEVIDLARLRRAAGPGSLARAQAGTSAPAAPSAGTTLGRRICGLVFCDVRGYSKISEQYSPLFQERFLGEASKVLESLGARFLTAQTAGDGIYATFDTARAAAEFSLGLRDLVGRVDWTEFGMPADTHVRAAVHCGPVFPITDPVTRRPNFCGTHVIRAARVEPVVTPGEVFVTEVVAAYLALQAPDDFECDYLGVLPLAKGAGSAPLYRLRRGQAMESGT